MKRRIFVCVIIGLAMFGLSVSQSQTRQFKAAKENVQQYETTFTITYNSISLREAARLDSLIRSNHTDACNVDIEIKEVSNLSIN